MPLIFSDRARRIADRQIDGLTCKLQSENLAKLCVPLNILNIINSGHSCLNHWPEYNLNAKRIYSTKAKLDWGRMTIGNWERTGE